MKMKHVTFALTLLALPVSAQDAGTNMSSPPTLEANGEKCMQKKVDTFYCKSFRDGVAYEMLQWRTVLLPTPKGQTDAKPWIILQGHGGSTLREATDLHPYSVGEILGGTLILPPDSSGGWVFLPSQSESPLQSATPNHGPITPDGENGPVR